MIYKQGNKNFFSKEEEFAAFEKFKNDEQKSSRDPIVLNYIKLVQSIAAKYSRFYGIDCEELTSEGIIGLIRAMNLFDHNRGFRFSTYASFWVKAYLRQYVLCSKSIVRRSRNRSSVTKAGSQASRTGTEARSKVFVADVSVDQNFGDDDESKQMLDVLPDERANLAENTMEKDLAVKRKAQFKKAFETLKAREKEVLKKRYFCNKVETLENISKQLNMTVEGIRQVEKRAIAKMKKVIGSGYD